MKHAIKIVSLVMLASFLIFNSFSLASSPYGIKKIPVFPTPLGYVSDYAELIDRNWHSRIRDVCKELEDRTGVEMIVATIESVKPYSHAREYAEKLYREWRIGTFQQEKGILLLTSQKERQAVVVLGRNLLPIIGKSELDILSERHLIPMFRNHEFGKSLYQATVGLASASGNVIKKPIKKKGSSSAGFWMNVAAVIAMLFALWRFTRPERKHPFQRWRRGEYWGTGQGGFGGGFGGFGGGTSGQGLS